MFVQLIEFEMELDIPTLSYRSVCSCMIYEFYLETSHSSDQFQIEPAKEMT